MSRGWASFFASAAFVLFLAVSLIAAVIIIGIGVVTLAIILPAVEKAEYRRILDGRAEPYPTMFADPGQRSLFITMAGDRWTQDGVPERYARAMEIAGPH
jgi:hypothetical protein